MAPTVSAKRRDCIENADHVTVVSEPRPRVVKIDPGVDASAADELLILAGPLLARLGEIVAIKLAARRGA